MHSIYNEFYNVYDQHFCSMAFSLLHKRSMEKKDNNSNSYIMSTLIYLWVGLC